ncbi:sugar-binding protein [Clostridium bowmanii]|uniref:multiple monosaccharide ABC transporter substrate-binding protein n=1 Tax=Clostridium bowmanii TaxID=132925 RepID=UPI001C0C523E|nr:multiple monosaccharide ABC transporter substrate-binding protein [Clostridium bowmanii]MBU3191951.1 sugar-binding protein [Clostridium bowmanii]MCA1074492.1 sugar-binding protein [Clostridium bowmanii]
MKRLLSTMLAVILMLSLMGCGETRSTSTSDLKAENNLVGVAMPTQSLQRWDGDGRNMKSQLEAKGYTVDLQYANNDVNTQIQEIENMITKKCKVLVVAAIDGATLTNVIKTAKENGIKVIAYDRLIMQTSNVDYYATFDNFKVGVIQGKYIETKLGLKEGKGPFNIELFGGSPDDNNATFFFKGAMSILKPYIDKGKLVIPSKQKNFTTIAIQSWDSAKAQGRMDNLITSTYSKGTKLNVILSPNDSLAIGIVASLKNAGYGTADKPFPILTGQDCDKPNIMAIINDKQSMSVFKDTRKLATKVVEMVSSILQGEKAEVNDTKTYNNGSVIVPSYLCDPVYVEKTNYKKILVDSGYYKAAELK